MHHHPDLVRSLIREHVAGLQNDAGANAGRRHYPRGPGIIEAVTQPIGWALVEVGLRLAVPRGSGRHPLARDTLAHRSRSA